jgi:anti-sigma factor RsiW
MPSCDSVRKELTAWVDGELSPRREEQVRRHLRSCPVCGAEAKAMRTAVEQQQQGLRRLDVAGDTDVPALYESLRRRLAQTRPRPPWWTLHLNPGRVVSAVAVAAAALTLAWMAGGTDAILIPLGLETPPPALAGQAELFKDYAVIQHLEVLESLDEKESVPVPEENRSSLG